MVKQESQKSCCSAQEQPREDDVRDKANRNQDEALIKVGCSLGSDQFAPLMPADLLYKQQA